MITFTHDDRLPYVITSSIAFGTDRMRVLRCTSKGSIASGAEEYDAPILDVPLSQFADSAFDQVAIITPDPETADAITTAAGRDAISLDDFGARVRATAEAMKADERPAQSLRARAAVDATSSAYSTAQRVYDLLQRQMPRVQTASVSSRVSPS
jgi:hypothetical protein